jgi:hypothetical protein
MGVLVVFYPGYRTTSKGWLTTKTGVPRGESLSYSDGSGGVVPGVLEQEPT